MAEPRNETLVQRKSDTLTIVAFDYRLKALEDRLERDAVEFRSRISKEVFGNGQPGLGEQIRQQREGLQRAMVMLFGRDNEPGIVDEVRSQAKNWRIVTWVLTALVTVTLGGLVNLYVKGNPYNDKAIAEMRNLLWDVTVDVRNIKRQQGGSPQNP